MTSNNSIALIVSLVLITGCRTSPAVRDYVELPDGELQVQTLNPIPRLESSFQQPTIALVDFQAAMPESNRDTAALPTSLTSPGTRGLPSAPGRPTQQVARNTDSDDKPLPPPPGPNAPTDKSQPKLRENDAADADVPPAPMELDSPIAMPNEEEQNAYPLGTDDCALRQNQVACLAASNATLANVLTQQANQSNCQSSVDDACNNACARQVRQKVLVFRALMDRNERAAQALMLYYGLAEIDQQSKLIELALKELSRNEERVASMRREKIEIPFDTTELRRTRAELSNKRAELKLKRSQANEQLLVLLGDDCESKFVFPLVDLTMDAAGIDANSAVDEGMVSRADLGLLNMLGNCLNAHTLSATNQALLLTSSLLGGSNCPPTLRSLLKVACHGPEPVSAAELARRRSQLAHLQTDLARQIESEIRSAVSEVETRLEQVRLGEETVAAWKQRSEELETLRQLDKATRFEISNAELQRITAESALIHTRSQARMAAVKLAKAQGRLALDCGYQLPSPYCCCQRMATPPRKASRRFRRK